MSIIGIDIGTLYTKVASVGKSGIRTLVSYTTKERLVGDAAFSQLSSTYNCSARGFFNLIGATINNNDLIEHESLYTMCRLSLEKENNFVSFNVEKSNSVTAVEILIPFLKKIKIMAEHYLKTPVLGAVIAIPVWFGIPEIDIVKKACVLAGLVCMSTIPHTYATVLDFGFFRRNIMQSENTTRVGFIDIGYSQCSVTVADFTTTGTTVILSIQSNELGCRELDRLLVEHYLQEFNKKFNCDASICKKAIFKLSVALEKVRKVLSANTNTTLNLECFFNDNDFKTTITREEFEQISESYREKLQKFFNFTMARLADIDDRKINSLEVIGGGTRAPFVIKCIESCFSLRLSRTLSSEECVARGAAIKAATLDPRFKVATFNLRHCLDSPVLLLFPKNFSARVAQCATSGIIFSLFYNTTASLKVGKVWNVIDPLKSSGIACFNYPSLYFDYDYLENLDFDQSDCLSQIMSAENLMPIYIEELNEKIIHLEIIHDEKALIIFNEAGAAALYSYNLINGSLELDLINQFEILFSEVIIKTYKNTSHGNYIALIGSENSLKLLKKILYSLEK
uniref:Heat shock protein homolog pss1-like n=1 Tax=Dermatophagoides pteronyssinus TaxID=6956 RepID=A0A6P6Y9R1_DERPT|nr:heat shock protein homolog pss1-like [Dermatophagoides pteronyssinus]